MKGRSAAGASFISITLAFSRMSHHCQSCLLYTSSLIVLLVMSVFAPIQAQTYDNLWKELEVLERKDLPLSLIHILLPGPAAMRSATSFWIIPVQQG